MIEFQKHKGIDSLWKQSR